MKFTHPNVESRVIDNSFVTIIGDGGATALFAPIFADKGRDNRLVQLSLLDEFINQYGLPSISRHGQQNYNVAEWLAAGGRAYVLRLLPDEARFANLTMTALLQDKDADRTVTIKAQSRDTSVSSVGAIKAYFETLPKEEVAIATFVPKGRGAGYNGLGIRFELTKDLDKTFDFRTYNMTVFTKDVTGADVVVEGPYRVSFYRDAKTLSQESMFFADVVNKYSKFISVVANDDAFEQITDYILGDDEVDPRIIDILAGTKPNNAHSEVEVSAVWTNSLVAPTEPNYSADAADLNRIQYLENGFDGDLSPANRERLLARAFDGLVDPTVLDTQGVDIDVVLDANFTNGIKGKAASFVRNREDCMFMADLGFQGDVEQTLEARKNGFTESSYFTAIFAQHGEVFDSYNGANIKVTTPFILASKIPAVDDSHGVHWTFVGPRRGVVTGFNNINFFPTEQQKEDLYVNKVNYIERDPRKMNLGSQVTSQAQNSALSDISHVRTLLKIKRQVERMCRDYRMEFNDKTTHENLMFDLNNALTVWTANRACTECNAVVNASEYEKLQRMARVTVNIRFTGILERIALDFVVGR